MFTRGFRDEEQVKRSSGRFCTSEHRDRLLPAKYTNWEKTNGLHGADGAQHEEYRQHGSDYRTVS